MLLPDGLTLGTLERFVNGIIQQLQNAGTTLEGNGSILIGGATTQITGLLAQLKAAIGDDFTKPIKELNRTIQDTANQIYSTVVKLDSLLQNQQACLLINSQVFLAGVNTITSGIKSGLPFISADVPRIDYFQFVGHTPSVVPKTGGQVIIHGFDLWDDINYPPEVNIYEADGATLNLNITPQKGQDIHSFSFNLQSSFIKNNQGKDLQLKVIPKEGRWLNLFHPKILGVFYLPMSIPKIQFAKFQLAAYLQYETDVETIEILEFKRFGMGNDSCEEKKDYSQAQAWPLPEGAQIISVETNSPDIVNQTNVQFSFAGNIITAAGWLDTATCINVGLGPFSVGRKLINDTHWWMNAAPKISYKKKGNTIVNATSDALELQDNKAQFIVKLPKANTSDISDTFWFQVIMDNGDIQTTIFTSPKNTANNFSTEAQGLMIVAKYNGVIVEGNADLSVEISLPNCGF